MIQLNSKKISSLFLSLVLSLAVITATAQDYKRQYRSARDLFTEGKYSEAMSGFKSLSVYDKDNPYNEYASFYYAMSAYRLGYTTVAKDMLLQIKKGYPKWDQMDEVNYLLCKTYFDQQEYFQALNVMDQIRNPAFMSDLQKLKKVYISQIEDPETLAHDAGRTSAGCRNS